MTSVGCDGRNVSVDGRAAAYDYKRAVVTVRWTGDVSGSLEIDADVANLIADALRAEAKRARRLVRQEVPPR